MIPMGGERDRHNRPTAPLELGALAKLADAVKPADTELSFEELEETTERPPTPPPPRSLLGRAQTMHDPLTTSLLAEVARRSQTSEFDAEDVERAREEPVRKQTPTTAKHAIRRR